MARASLLCLAPLCTLGCRWAAYIGRPEASASAIFLRAEHSLVRQSYLPPYVPLLSEQEFFSSSQVAARNHEVNRDGWGLGFSGGSHALEVRKSASGATDALNKTDPDLDELARAVRSTLLFCHLRAATDGEANPINSHPFLFDGQVANRRSQVLWMHNGGLENYRAMVERVRESAAFPQSVFEQIRGSTDSELAGALFLHFAQGVESNDTAGAMRIAMKRTIHELDDHDDDPHMLEVGERLCPASEPEAAEEIASSMNFAASDGEMLVATRFRTCGRQEPPTLYYALGSHLDADGFMHRELGAKEDEGSALLVSSEPLYFNLDVDEVEGGADSSRAAPWKLLAKDQMLLYDRRSARLRLECLSEACERAIYRVEL